MIRYLSILGNTSLIPRLSIEYLSSIHVSIQLGGLKGLRIRLARLNTYWPPRYLPKVNNNL